MRKIICVASLIAGLLIVSQWITDNRAVAWTPNSLGVTSLAITLSNSASDATHPFVAVTANNRVFVAWEQANETGGTRDVFFSQKSSGANWSTPTWVFTSTANSLRPIMASDRNNAIQIIWDEDTDGTSVTYQTQLGNTTAITIAPSVTNAPSTHDVVIDTNNVIHVVMPGNKTGFITPHNVFYTRKSASVGSWPAATAIYTNSLGVGSQYMAIDSDSKNNLHVVWQENKTANDGIIYYMKGVPSGNTISWTSPTDISAMANFTDTASPAITVDSNDVVHVVWVSYVSRSEQYIYYTHSTNNSAGTSAPTTWGTPTLVTAQAVGANDTSPRYVSPDIAVADSAVYVVWHNNIYDTNGKEDVFYTRSFNNGTTWGTPVNLSQTSDTYSRFPKLAVDNQNTVHIVWEEEVNGTLTVQYVHFLHIVFLPIVMKGF